MKQPNTPKQFREMRKQLKLTQTTLAKWFGVSDQAIARWEKEQSRVPASAYVLLWLIYDEQINGNKRAVKDYIAATIGRRAFAAR